MKVLLGSNYEQSYAEDAKKRLTSVKHYIMKANMVKRDKSERKRIPDTKSIASKKRSEEFLVQEVWFKNYYGSWFKSYNEKLAEHLSNKVTILTNKSEEFVWNTFSSQHINVLLICIRIKFSFQRKQI